MGKIDKASHILEEWAKWKNNGTNPKVGAVSCVFFLSQYSCF